MKLDPIEELLVANYLVNPDFRFKTMDELRSWAAHTSKLIRRKIMKLELGDRVQLVTDKHDRFDNEVKMIFDSRVEVYNHLSSKLSTIERSLIKAKQ